MRDRAGASMDVAPESGRALRTLFAVFDQSVRTWKTSPDSGHADSISSLRTWPRQGMTCAGHAYALAQSAPRISGSDGSESLLLLKTPTSNLAFNGGARHPDERRAGGHGPTLDDEVVYLLPASGWGDFTPAIERWERITRQPAPVPIETGPKGGMRITARFAEWLMGLPPAWVTGVRGLDRAENLRAIGNSVVPLQAFTAYRHLMRESTK